MSDVSKDTLLEIFQQRMDKCTNEQFWAVAALSALYAGVLSQSTLPSNLPKVVAIPGITLATLYGVFFVIHRHKAYYEYRNDFAHLVNDCPFAPKYLKEVRNPWELRSLTGLAFYLLWIAGGHVGSMFVLLT